MQNRIITAENQIQRVNEIITKVQAIQKLPISTLTQRPDPKKWSVIEVVGHMNSAYRLYEERINQLLHQLPNKQVNGDNFKAGRKNALFINLITPRGTERPMKMKTMKRFEPIFKVEDLDTQKVAAVFQQFFTYQEHIKKASQESRKKKTDAGKLVSAIGPLVKFHLPEALEFIIGHEERHIVQIEEVLQVQA